MRYLRISLAASGTLLVCAAKQSRARASRAEAVDMREVPECVAEFQLTAPAQLSLGSKEANQELHRASASFVL